MKVVIAGSRSFLNRFMEEVKIHKLSGYQSNKRLNLDAAIRFIDSIVAKSGFEITEVVSGTAKGIDQFGEAWARKKGIPIKRFAAKWDQYGKAAGFMRNKEMAAYADAAIVCWNGESHGSANMIDNIDMENKPCHLEIIRNYEEIKL